MVMSEKKKTAFLEDIPADRALKLNVDGAGNYRAAYDASSWKSSARITAPEMSAADKVNLQGDAWAFCPSRATATGFFTPIWSVACRRT